MAFPKVSKLKTAEIFREHLESIGVSLPFDEAINSNDGAPLAQSFSVGDAICGNRFCILPMEGWDGTRDGLPTDLTRRRWKNFGLSGAKLIWGGEAVSVRPDGKANPNQLMLNEQTVGEISNLRQTLIDAHEEAYSTSSDLLVGLQLTHSGRFARPNDKAKIEPRTAYKLSLIHI